MKHLDKTDYSILELLQKDAKSTIKEIAAHLGMTTTPVYERIRRMEEEGFIKGYVALVDKEKLDYQILAFCHVSLQEHHRTILDYFESETKKLHEITECYHVAGNHDYLLKIVARDMLAYQEFVTNKLAALSHISQIQTVFVMSEVKCSTALHFSS